MSTELGRLRRRIEAVREQAEAAANVTRSASWWTPAWDVYAGTGLGDDPAAGRDADVLLAETQETIVADHITAHDPASVIAACDADLALLDYLADLFPKALLDSGEGLLRLVLLNLNDRYPSPAGSGSTTNGTGDD